MRNAIKLLTKDELEAFEKRYSFDYNAESNSVIVNSGNRSTIHSAEETFFINSKIRKVSFNPEAIKIWLQIKKIRPSIYTLPRVQMAANTAKLLYQPVTKELVIRLIDNPNVKVN